LQTRSFHRFSGFKAAAIEEREKKGITRAVGGTEELCDFIGRKNRRKMVKSAGHSLSKASIGVGFDIFRLFFRGVWFGVLLQTSSGRCEFCMGA